MRGAVAWTLGDPCLTIHGGMSRLTGEQSTLTLHPIVASTGHARPAAIDPAPALTNVALFARDRMLCLYCGNHFHRVELTRDHVMPVSKGGRDEWENVVTACWSCNVRKGGRTPQQANMPLLAVPYRPSWVEHLILSNRNILADQMEFLVNHLPKSRRPRTEDRSRALISPQHPTLRSAPCADVAARGAFGWMRTAPHPCSSPRSATGSHGAPKRRSPVALNARVFACASSIALPKK